jgi:hypothetical protein
MTAQDAPGHATGLGRHAYYGDTADRPAVRGVRARTAARTRGPRGGGASGCGRLGQSMSWAVRVLGRHGRGCRGQRCTASDGRRTERATSRCAALCLLLFRWYCFGNRIALIFCIEVDQVMNTKVVDLATLNNFYKGYIEFFGTEYELFECQYLMSTCLRQQ